MEVRIHDVISVKEILNTHQGDYKFITRAIEITDKDNNTHTLTMFGQHQSELLTSNVEANHYD